MLNHKGQETLVKIWDVLYCPDLAVNLVFIRKLDDTGMRTGFGDGSVTLKRHDRVIFGSGSGHENHNLYELHVTPASTQTMP